MDAVETFLLCVVWISVSAVLIISHIEEEQRKKPGYDCQEEGKSVGGDGGTEKSGIGGAEKQITSEIEVGRENPVGVVCDVGTGKSEIGDPEKQNSPEIEVERENPVSVDCEKDEFVDDDWEGVERSELEKVFGEAVVFASCCSTCDDDEDLKLELFGLSKIALEGPCYGSQPMPFMVAARSKWTAWQKLGDMSRETAMEKYIDILSKAIPGWKGKDATTCDEDLTLTSENTH